MINSEFMVELKKKSTWHVACIIKKIGISRW